MLTQEQQDAVEVAVRRLISAVINKVGVNAGVAIPRLESYDVKIEELKNTIEDQKQQITDLVTRVSLLEASAITPDAITPTE